MNPFGVTYNSAYFCDREDEIRCLVNNFENGLNTLIHSPRRLGKTALIQHYFKGLEKNRNVETLYIDLFSTQNMNDLIQVLAEKILDTFHKKNILKGVTNLLKGISPVITFGADGLPSIQLNLQEHQQKQTLTSLFGFLEKQKKKIIIAFDEFQEVATYPEKGEALLRSYIQHLKNICFIYSGSSNHILENMFYGASRPFYQSSEVLVLEKIEKTVYADFIDSSFKKNGKKITTESLEYILEFSDTYTYYTQILCNQCFAKTEKTLEIANTRKIIDEYLESRKSDYFQLYSLLPENQKKVIKAIAKEGEVKQPSAFDFIVKYKLPSASSTMLATKSMLEKELIIFKHGTYLVYDVFFKQFLKKYY